MRPSPPAHLVDLLGRLHLASDGDVVRQHRRVRRLSRDLAALPCVWVDALVQARHLSPYQAAEIHAGRGERLAVGELTIVRPRRGPAYTRCYEARDHATGEAARLLLIPSERVGPDTLRDLALVVERCQTIAGRQLLAIERWGECAEGIWATCPLGEGRSAAELLGRHGRFPPAVVCEVARQMAATLAVCEAGGVIHGDLGPAQLLLDVGGLVRLIAPGLRGVAPLPFPAAGADLAPDAFDYTAPELLHDHRAPTVASDVYACGLLWWHLLAGRSPIAGATLEIKLRSIERLKLPNIRHVAPDTAPALAELISQCAEADPARRPESFSALVERLGPPSASGAQHLARFAGRGTGPPARLLRRVSTKRPSPNTPVYCAAAGGAALALALALWPQWSCLVVPAREPLVIAQPTEPRPPSPAAGDGTAATAPGRAASSAREPQRAIELASATLPLHAGPARAVVGQPPDGGNSVALGALRLAAGQTVGGRVGARLRLLVDHSAEAITAEDVRFENVDFVIAADASPAAILRISAARLEFRRCSFHSSGAAQAAIHWLPQQAPEARSSAPPRITFDRCTSTTAGGLLWIDDDADVQASFDQVLHLGAGPLVRLTALPRTRATQRVALSHCTLREARAVVRADGARGAGEPGTLAVAANDCALAIAPHGSLCLLVDDQEPTAWLRAIHWQGSGSLVAPAAELVAWQGLDGQARALRSPSPRFTGLARSEMGFAGGAGDGPAGSQLVRWQVPLRSPQPPGICEERLGWPNP